MKHLNFESNNLSGLYDAKVMADHPKAVWFIHRRAPGDTYFEPVRLRHHARH